MAETPDEPQTTKQRSLWSTARIEPGSMTQFVRRLHGDEEEPGDGASAFGLATGLNSDIQGIHLSCSRVEWEQRFGPPVNVLDHDAAHARLTIQTWDQPCIDGYVLCVGHLHRGLAGDSWVVLIRTYRSGEIAGRSGSADNHGLRQIPA